MEKLGIRKDRWMTTLPESTKKSPISTLCIPGSHDSFTYSLIRSSYAGPDQPQVIRKWAEDFPWLAKKILWRWSFTQYKDARFQLESGIRYFDIRLEAKGEPGKRKYYVLHCLQGALVSGILVQIREFLAENPGEFLILDFQHVYEFVPEDHTNLTNIIRDTFKGLLCPNLGSFSQVTPEFLQTHGYQVIVVYPTHVGPDHWPRRSCPTPWPNTTSATTLTRFLEGGLATRDPLNCLFVSQGVFTPTKSTILLNIFSDLDKACARQCNAAMLAWLTSSIPLKRKFLPWKGSPPPPTTAPPRPNIFICDFTISCSVTVRMVDALILNNYNLLTSS